MPIKQTEKGSGDPLRIGGQVYAEREKKADAGGKDPETQQSIYNLENRTQELYEQLQELLEEQKRQELEKLSDALNEAGVSVEEVLEQLRTQEESGQTAHIA